MSPEQALAICRLAKGAFPATSVDELTPDAWALALEDDRFEDARVALKELMREQTFIHVSDICQRIKKIRNQRVLDFGPLPNPPGELADNPPAEIAWTRRIVRAIADGEPVERPAIPAAGDRPNIDFASVLPSVPE